MKRLLIVLLFAATAWAQYPAESITWTKYQPTGIYTKGWVWALYDPVNQGVITYLRGNDDDIYSHGLFRWKDGAFTALVNNDNSDCAGVSASTPPGYVTTTVPSARHPYLQGFVDSLQRKIMQYSGVNCSGYSPEDLYGYNLLTTPGVWSQIKAWGTLHSAFGATGTIENGSAYDEDDNLAVFYGTDFGGSNPKLQIFCTHDDYGPCTAATGATTSNPIFVNKAPSGIPGTAKGAKVMYVGNHLFLIFGGYNNTPTFSTAVYVYDVISNTLTEKSIYGGTAPTASDDASNPLADWNPITMKMYYWKPSNATMYIFDPWTNEGKGAWATITDSGTGPDHNGGADCSSTSCGSMAYNPSTNQLIAFSKEAGRSEISVYVGQLTSPGVDGLGASTTGCKDRDGDTYGVGPGCAGVDADDTDAAVHSTAQMLSAHTDIPGVLTYWGYPTGHVWYLATNGNDTTCAENNESLPCATMAHIKPSLSAGRVVVVRGGTYAATWFDLESLTGAYNNRIVIMAYPGEKPILRHRTVGTCVDITYSSGMVIDGIVCDGENSTNAFKGVAAGVVTPGTTTHDIIIKNMDISYGQNGMLLVSINNFRIYDNVVWNTSQSHSIYLGSYNTVSDSANVFVRYNLMYGSGGGANLNCFQYNGVVTNMWVDANMIHSCPQKGMSLLQGVSKSTIRRNVVFNNKENPFLFFNYDGDGFGAGEDCVDICPHDQIHNVIKGNTFAMGTKSPIAGAATTFWGIEAGDSVVTEAHRDLGHNLYRNNIIVSADDLHVPVAFGIETGHQSGAGFAATSVFDGNIYWTSTGTSGVVFQDRYVGDPPGTIMNCAEAASFTILLNCYNSNPLFTHIDVNDWNNPAAWILTIAAGSPALDAASGWDMHDSIGTDMAVPATIGALESAASPATTYLPMLQP